MKLEKCDGFCIEEGRGERDAYLHAKHLSMRCNIIKGWKWIKYIASQGYAGMII
jgi:hypothetical protein